MTISVQMGQRFDRGVVVDPEVTLTRKSGLKRRGARMLCDCGDEYEAEIYSLLSGKQVSCGCKRSERCREMAITRTGIPGRTQRAKVLANYRHGAHSRGHAWELTDREFDKLIASDCFYCGTPPRRVHIGKYGDLIRNGIDRVDNALGYTSQNVVAACTFCNRAKGNMLAGEFLSWLDGLVIYRSKVVPVYKSETTRKL